jgi:hypothetical protein
MSDDQELVRNAGAISDQYITGSEETGEFTTDKPPVDDTPPSSGSNSGINVQHANRVDHDPEADQDVNG